jgi:hypothetical protein
MPDLLKSSPQEASAMKLTLQEGRREDEPNFLLRPVGVSGQGMKDLEAARGRLCGGGTS